MSFELQAGEAGGGEEGLAAEAEGGDRQEVVGGAELRGGVALEGEEGVVLDHAVAVVGDADEFPASGFYFDADAGCAGVERVFEELFDDGGGALDDLAGGDLVRHEVGEDAAAAHESIVRGRLHGMADWEVRRRGVGLETNAGQTASQGKGGVR